MYTNKPIEYFGASTLHQYDELRYLVHSYDLPNNWAIITGHCISDDAKIIGITPAVLTFNGMFVDCPPTVLLPLTFWEYWTGILLSPSWRKHTRTTITIRIANIITAAKTPFAGVFGATNVLYNVAKSLGIPDMILIKSTIEIPFPTPFSVIRSPSHINTAEPAVSAAITTIIHTT